MNSNKILDSFHELINEFTNYIDLIQNQGADLLKESQYDSAQKCVQNARKLKELKQLVIKQQEIWNGLDINIFDKNTLREKLSSTDYVKDDKKGEDYNSIIEKFSLPILEVLYEMGGFGKQKEIINRFGVKNNKILTDDDWRSDPRNPNILKWQVDVVSVIKLLASHGFLDHLDKPATWRLTESGQDHLFLKRI